MSTNTQNIPDRKPVPMTVTIAVVTALIAFIGYMGSRTMVNSGNTYLQNTPPVKELPSKTVNNDWILIKAVETGGDISKMDKDSRLWLERITHGRGAAQLKAAYQKSLQGNAPK